MSHKPKAIIAQELLTLLKVDVMRNDTWITSATGFFYRSGPNAAFVSNWHVFSGRNPYTGQPLERTTGVTPTKLRASYFDIAANLLRTFECPAGCDDGPGLWLQHPSGQKIDVALVKLPESALKGLSPIPAASGTPLAEEQQPILQVTSEVFIVGFPHGLQKQDFLPIWKRGSIASEPDLPVDGVPVFLVDSITRDGMSGSPVYFRGDRYETKAAPDAQRTFKIAGPPLTQLLGIYSGRFGASDPLEELHLARVWKKQLIDEILLSGVPGNFELIAGT